MAVLLELKPDSCLYWLYCDWIKQCTSTICLVPYIFS